MAASAPASAATTGSLAPSGADLLQYGASFALVILLLVGLLWALKRLQGTYSDHLLGIVRWCMALDPARRPRSVFELQAELNREVERRHSAPGWLDRLRLGLDDLSGWLRQGWRRLLPSQGQPR